MQALTTAALALSLGIAAPVQADPRQVSPDASSPDLGMPATRELASVPPAASTPPPQLPRAAAAEASADSSHLDARTKPTCLGSKGPCRQLTITGSVFTSLGLAAVGAGIGLLATPAKDLPDEPAYQISYQPPGVVALGMGIGVLATGILMIVAGRRALKQPQTLPATAFRGAR